MWRLAAAGALAALLGVIALSMQATSVHACSAGPDFDPIASSDVVVGGRMLGYEVIDEYVVGSDPPEERAKHTGFSTVAVEMNVDAIYKGTLSDPTITLVDGRSLVVYDHEPFHVWAGSSGACGAFSSDPTGQYAILGVNARENGTYGPSLPLVFYLGEPSGDSFDRALERMASFPGAATLPALGSGPASGSPGDHLAIGAAALGVALLAAASALRYRSRRMM